MPLGGNLFLRYPICSLNLAPYIVVGGGAAWDGTCIGYGNVGGGVEYRVTKNIGLFVDGRYFYGGSGNVANLRSGPSFRILNLARRREILPASMPEKAVSGLPHRRTCLLAAVQQARHGADIEDRFCDERTDIHKLLFLPLGGIVLRAMGVITQWPQAIERRKTIPQNIPSLNPPRDSAFTWRDISAPAFSQMAKSLSDAALRGHGGVSYS